MTLAKVVREYHELEKYRTKLLRSKRLIYKHSAVFTGSRDWEWFAPVEEAMSLLNPRKCDIYTGGAKGLDSIASSVVESLGIGNTFVEADWREGKSAGPRRNREMLLQALNNCEPEDVVVLGFRNKDDSVGTTDCLAAALDLGMHNVFVFDAFPTAYKPFEWRYF